MKKTLIITISVVVLLTGGAVWLTAAPTVTEFAVNPTVIAVNTSTLVLFTTKIDDASVIPTGVNLLRVGANGAASIVGTMRDDGTNGDVVAGDKIFSARMAFNETTAGNLQFQVSVAFKGMLRRVTSNLISISIWRKFTVQDFGYEVGIPPSFAGTLTPTGVLEVTDSSQTDGELPGFWIYTYANPTGLTPEKWWLQNPNHDPQNETLQSVVIAGLPGLEVVVTDGFRETYVIVTNGPRIYKILRIGEDDAVLQSFLTSLTFL